MPRTVIASQRRVVTTEYCRSIDALYRTSSAYTKSRRYGQKFEFIDYDSVTDRWYSTPQLGLALGSDCSDELTITDAKMIHGMRVAGLLLVLR